MNKKAIENIYITARKKGGSEEYNPLFENELSAELSLSDLFACGVENSGESEIGQSDENTGADVKESRTASENNKQDEEKDRPAGERIIEVKITASEDFCGVIRLAMPVSKEGDARFFLPGFMYGTNRGEAPELVDSKTPRLKKNGGYPTSPWWMVRSDRLSHPCAFSFANGRIRGFCASPYFVYADGKRVTWNPGVSGEFDQYAGFGCSLEKGEVWYTLGYENAPYLFVDSHTIEPRAKMEKNCFTIKKGETVTVCLHCFDFRAEDERGIHAALKKVYEIYHESPRDIRSPKEAIAEMAGAIKEDAWLADKHSYSCFVFDKDDGFEYRLLPSISWTNGLAAAVPMLASSRMLGDDTMREQALDCIEHIVKNSINDNNDLPFVVEQDGVWSNRGWWYDKQAVPGHAAYLVGQAVYLILKAYVMEKESGTVHENWLEFAKRVISRTELSRNSDGEYPYIFSEKTGAGLEYDSFSGAWCMAAAAFYSLITGERDYIPELLRSEKWYHESYIKHQECYGGPLDIDKNIDSEGILSYIRAVRCLHEITGDDILLEHLRDAFYYEFTFKFCYNSPIKVPPLSKTGWSSCGGSITSVTNPHIHPMSSSVLGEMAYFIRNSEDEYIKNRYNDTLLWSCQCHNTFDGEYDYGKTGWMSERFCHSEGLLTEKYPDGEPASTWFALMPWACGSLLEGLNDVGRDR